MSLLFRLVIVLARALLSPSRENILATRTLGLRVYPNDLDLNFHVNNGRYLTYLDLGRIDHLVRHGVLQKAVKLGWMPVVATVNFQFLAQMKAFERFTIATRIVGWDERWTYVEQIIERDGRRVGKGMVLAAVTSKRGPVPVSEIVRAMGQDVSSPPVPPEYLALRDAFLAEKAAARAARG